MDGKVHALSGTESRPYRGIFSQAAGLLSRASASRRIAILGSGALGQSLAEQLTKSLCRGSRLIGLFDDRQPAEGRVVMSGAAPICGDFEALLKQCRSGAVNTVYLALPLVAEARIRSLVERLADVPVAVHLVPDFFGFGLLRGRIEQIGDLCTLSVFDTPMTGISGPLKRLFDLLLASAVLCLIALPMLLIAIAIKASGAGPVIFKQRRSGLDGREIVVWKFRTMTVAEDGDSVVQASENDPRVTPLGAFLRLTSLDELPQFFNVIQGRMSIVGPRPHALAHNEEYRRLITFYMLRHRVKPGITGWAQINGWRGETEQLSKMEARISHDLWYIRNWTPWLDLKIFFITIGQMLESLFRTGLPTLRKRRPNPAPSVLLLVENLPVPLDRRVWLEARSLRDRGYRVTVICPQMYSQTEKFEQLAGIDIHRVPLPFEAKGLLGYGLEYGTVLTLMLFKALRVWMRSGIDVIHVANPPDLLWLVALPFKLAGARVIYDQHDLCPELFQAKGQGGRALQWLLLALERISYRVANAVIVPNHSYRDIAVARGGKASDAVFVVRNGPLRNVLAPKPNVPISPLIGYVGVMGDQDSVDVAIEVAAKLKDRYPDVRYLFLGDGTHRAHYEQYAEDLGVSDRVRFTGMVDQARMAEELAPCQLCIVPDRVNAFSLRSTMNKVMEYMALGKPIVQFDTPEGRYSAESASLYATANDVEDLTAKVAELLDDPARARQMGRTGRGRFLKSLHWDCSVESLYAAYSYVLGQGRQRIDQDRIDAEQIDLHREAS